MSHFLESPLFGSHATLSPQNVLQGNYDVAFYTVEAFNIQGKNLGNQLDCSLIVQSAEAGAEVVKRKLGLK